LGLNLLPKRFARTKSTHFWFRLNVGSHSPTSR
jgi:hypothetical protein